MKRPRKQILCLFPTVGQGPVQDIFKKICLLDYKRNRAREKSGGYEMRRILGNIHKIRKHSTVLLNSARDGESVPEIGQI